MILVPALLVALASGRAPDDPAAPAAPPAASEAAPAASAAHGISLEALLDIVVTATLREQSSIDAPASITVVDAAEIEARGYRTLKAVMNDVPGFNDVTDVNEEIVGVRGVFASTTNKILILIDGHRMNDLMLGRYNVDQYLGMAAVARIEFIRGPASALYGSGALVGLVNVITKKGSDAPGITLGLRGGPHAREAHVSWGRARPSGDAGYDLFFDFTFLDGPGHAIAQPAELDVVPPGQQPRAGRVFLARYPENLSGLFTLRGDDVALTVRGAHFRRVPPRAATGSFYEPAAEPFAPAYTENDFFIDHSASFALGAAGRTRLTLNPSVHVFSYYEQSFLTFGANRVPPLGQRSGMQGEFHNYRLRLTLERRVADAVDVTTGLDGLLASFYRSDAVTIVGDRVVVTPEGYTTTGRWFLGGAFVQAMFAPLPSLSVTAGARYDTFGDEAAPELTPRIGVVWRPSDAVALKALYGRAYLAPMWAHKRANDGNFVGTPNLAPESFESLGLVLAYVDRRTSATLDGFLNRADGLINSVPRPGPGQDGSEGMRYSYENVGRSVYLGVDAAAETRPVPWLRLGASYSHIRPVTHGDATSAALLAAGHIRDIAHHTWRYGVRVDPVARLAISLWGRAYGATHTVDPIAARATTAPVALLDASIRYDFGTVALALHGSNVTDRSYERGGTGPRPLARPGVALEAALTARF